MFLFKDKKIDSYEELLKTVGKVTGQEDADELYKLICLEFGEKDGRSILGHFLSYFKTPEDRQRVSKLFKDVKHPFAPHITERALPVEEAMKLGVEHMLTVRDVGMRPYKHWSAEDVTPKKRTVFEEREDNAEWNI